jgi:hypothetical protein
VKRLHENIYDNVKKPEDDRYDKYDTYIQALLYHCWKILYYTTYSSWGSNRPIWLIPLQTEYDEKKKKDNKGWYDGTGR